MLHWLCCWQEVHLGERLNVFRHNENQFIENMSHFLCFFTSSCVYGGSACIYLGTCERSSIRWSPLPFAKLNFCLTISNFVSARWRFWVVLVKLREVGQSITGPLAGAAWAYILLKLVHLIQSPIQRLFFNLVFFQSTWSCWICRLL